MKHFLFLTFIFMLSSCGLLRRSAIPHVERYVIFYTDSFEIYYNIDTLIHYCEEIDSLEVAEDIDSLGVELLYAVRLDYADTEEVVVDWWLVMIRMMIPMSIRN